MKISKAPVLGVARKSVRNVGGPTFGAWLRIGVGSLTVNLGSGCRR